MNSLTRMAYTWVSADSLQAYRRQLKRVSSETGGHYAKLDEYLDLWARWHAGEFRTSGGGGMMPAYNENHDMPKCTGMDINGTAFEGLMLDIERAYNKLPGFMQPELADRSPELQLPVFCIYRKDMGREASALACGLSVRGFDGRLNLAYHHLAAHLNQR